MQSSPNGPENKKCNEASNNTYNKVPQFARQGCKKLLTWIIVDAINLMHGTSIAQRPVDHYIH